MTAALLAAQTAGVPPGTVWTLLAITVARGETVRDLNAAVRNWQLQHPGGRR